MTRLELLVGILIAGLVAYPIVMRLLAKAVQPSRLRMAQIGNELLISGELDAVQGYYVQTMLDDAFSPRAAIVLAIAFPFFVAGRAIGRIPDLKILHSSIDIKDKLDELSKLHTLAIAAANPVFFAIIIVEAILFAGLVAPFALFRGTLRVGGTFEINAYTAARGRRFRRHSPA